MNYFEEIIYQEANNLITNKLIEIEADSTKYFDKVESVFPVDMNRIAWEKVVNRIEEFPGKSLNELEELKKFITNFINKYNITLAKKVIYFGDNINIAIQMSLETFLNNLDIFCTIPQHTYLIPEDISWCFNYTFEGYLYFGFAVS
jgi:type III secretion system FlhB-like substrate exporter